MVEEPWLAYLRTWADGAEFYGRQHPHVPFSFRDLFLDNRKANQLLGHHLVTQVAEKMDHTLHSNKKKTTKQRQKEKNYCRYALLLPAIPWFGGQRQGRRGRR
jgi:hypothetical protein